MTDYLKRSDYQQAIREEHLLQVLDIDLDTYLDQAELAGIKEVQSYLRGVYDLTLLFPAINDWATNVSYLTDAYVWYQGSIYQSITDIVINGTNSNAPDVDILNCKINDPRDPWILRLLIDIVLYHVHKTVSPREVPKHRLIAYDQAIYNLKMMRDGELSPDMPTVETPRSSPTIFGDKPNNWLF